MLEGVLYELISREERTAIVRLLPESPVYEAHFPGYPVTPGVTLVQMALECMGRDLKAAKDIKFMVPVLPQDEGPVLRFEWTLTNHEAQVFVYLPQDVLCAKMAFSV